MSDLGRDRPTSLTDEVDPKLVITTTTLPGPGQPDPGQVPRPGLLLRVFSDNASNRSIITGTSRKPQVGPDMDTGAGRIRVNYDPATAQPSSPIKTRCLASQSPAGRQPSLSV